jgi:crotonobetainyl-CoA:carnitine CoA-transferase CaiB-like acyl-CoA transferase
MRGLRVIDLSTGIAGAYCARLFAATGGDVVVAEPPGGSPLRAAGPYVDVPGSGPVSPLWEYLGAGKRSIVTDRGDDETAGMLLRWADVVVLDHDGRPADAAERVARIHTVNPAAVVTVLSGFGLDGPYASWRSSVLGDWAASGHLFLTGDVDREPLQGGGPWDTYLHGAVAAVGTAAAVIHAARTGEGQVVDVSAIEALASMHQWTVTMYTHNGTVKRRWGNLLGESSHPIALYHCQDGDISIVAVSPPQWEALCIAMELWDLLADHRLDVIGERFDRAAEIDARINEWLSTRRVTEAIEYLRERGVPASRLLTLSQVLHEEQLARRRFLVEPESLGKGAAMPWMPFRLEDRDVAFRAAPALGAHTDEVLTGVADPHPPRPQLNLRDVRVLEFGIAWAGPLAGRFLGDFGADVVKVEHPATRGVLPPDPTFAEGWTWGTLPHPMVRFPVFPDNEPGDRWWNRSGMFNKINRSKRSIGLDAKTGSGGEILRRLIAASDVVLNNYSPRGAQSLGIDPISVRATNPLAVTVSMSGYGSSGPLAKNMSYGPVLQAHAGFDEATGYEGGGPQRLGVAYPDAVGGTHGAFAILAALWERSLTDAPVHVDLSQLETLLSIAGDMLLATSLTGLDPVRHGNRSWTDAPQGVYPCAGDDSWVAITVDSDEAWQALVDIVGDLLAARRHDDLVARHAAADELDAAIAAWTRTRTKFEVAGELQARRIVAVPVMTNRDLVEDQHMVARGFIAILDQPDVGRRGFPGAPLHLTRTPIVCRPSPGLGQDNAAVLGEYLGLDEAAVTALAADGVIGDRPPV